MKKLIAAFALLCAALMAHAQSYPSPQYSTPSQFDNSNKAATTAFVKAAGLQYTASGGIVIGSNTTLTTSQLNNWAIFTVATAVATLPASSSTQTGATMTFIGGSTGGTIKGSGSDAIVSAQTTTANTLFVASGQTVTVSNEGGGNWYVSHTGKGTATNACQNVLDYGADPTATNSSDSAVASAIAAGPSGQACIYFPAGTYKFSSQIAYTLPGTTAGITIKGDGPTLSILKWAANGGIEIIMPGGAGNNAHVRDLSILAGAAGTGNAGLQFVNATNNSAPQPSEASDVTNVSFHGSDGYAQTYYWPEAILVASWSNINFTNVIAYGGGGGGDLSGYSGQGVGIDFTGSSGSSAPPQGTAYNVSNSFFNYLLYGIFYSDWVQGVTVNQTNFTGGKYGIYVGTPDQGQDQLTIIGSQFNESDAGIQDNVGTPGLMIIGNYFLIPTPTGSNSGILLASTYEATVSNNVFQRIGSSATNTNGLTIGTNIYAGAMVTGNVFTGLGAGIFLESGSSGHNVQSNSYHSNSSNIYDLGSGNTKGGGSQ